MASQHPGAAAAGPAEDRRHPRSSRFRVRRPRGARDRQDPVGRAGGGDPGVRERAAVLRRRRAAAGGHGRRGVHAGPHLGGPPRAGGRLRADRAVELPADDGGLEDRTGAGRGQHRGAQAGRDDAVDRRAAGRGRGGVPAGGRVHRADRRPRHRPRAGASPDHGPRLDHRVDAGGHRRRHGRGRRPQAHPPGAGRQRTAAGLPRRRPRRDGGRHRGRRVLQRGSGLHRGQPGAGARVDPRRLRRFAGEGRGGADARRRLRALEQRGAVLARRGPDLAAALARPRRNRRDAVRHSGLLLLPLGDLRPAPGRRDRPGRDLRTGHHRSVLFGRSPGGFAGQRCPVRAGVVGLDERPRRRRAGVGRPRLRLRVGDHSRAAGRREAARRVRPLRSRQGPLVVRLRRVHAGQARDDEVRMSGKITEVEQHGIAPIPTEEQTSRPRDLFRMAFGGANTFATIILGTLPIAYGLSFRDAALATALGVVVGGLVLAPMALFGPRTRTNNAVSSGAHFGVVGRCVGSFLSLLTAITFFAISVWVSGDAVAGAAQRLFGFDGGAALRGIAYGLIALATLVVCICGYRFMLLLSGVAVVLGTAIMLLGSVAYGGSFDPGYAGTGTYALGTFWPTFTLAALPALADPISFGAFLGDWARYIPARHSKRSLLAAPFLAQVATLLPFGFGIATATLVADPADYITGLTAVSPLWYAIPLIVGALIGGLSTGTTSLYGTGLDFSSIFPRLSRVQATLLIGTLSVAFIAT